MSEEGYTIQQTTVKRNFLLKLQAKTTVILHGIVADRLGNTGQRAIKITTRKSQQSTLKTTAKVVLKNGSLETTMVGPGNDGDFSKTIFEEPCGTITSSEISNQHTRALDRVTELVADVTAYYSQKDTPTDRMIPTSNTSGILSMDDDLFGP